MVLLIFYIQETAGHSSSIGLYFVMGPGTKDQVDRLLTGPASGTC